MQSTIQCCHLALKQSNLEYNLSCAFQQINCNVHKDVLHTCCEVYNSSCSAAVLLLIPLPGRPSSRETASGSLLGETYIVSFIITANCKRSQDQGFLYSIRLNEVRKTVVKDRRWLNPQFLQHSESIQLFSH